MNIAKNRSKSAPDMVKLLLLSGNLSVESAESIMEAAAMESRNRCYAVTIMRKPYN